MPGLHGAVLRVLSPGRGRTLEASHFSVFNHRHVSALHLHERGVLGSEKPCSPHLVCSPHARTQKGSNLNDGLGVDQNHSSELLLFQQMEDLIFLQLPFLEAPQDKDASIAYLLNAENL